MSSPIYFLRARAPFALGAAFLLALQTNPTLHAATVTWDNGAGNNTWSTATNWDTNTVPVASDTVIINNGDTVYTGNITFPLYLNITLSNSSILSSNVNATTGGVGRLRLTNLTVESGSSFSGSSWWDLDRSTLTFYDGAIANMANWEYRGNTSVKFILGSSGFTTLTPGTLRIGSGNATNQSYVVDFANYTGGSTTLTLMDFTSSAYSTLNATSFLTGNFTYLNTGGYYSGSMSYNATTYAISLAITEVVPTWSGGGGNWDTGFSPAAKNGKGLTFSGAGGTATNNIVSGNLSSVGAITFNSGAGAYTLAANSGSAGNGSALTVTGGITNNSSSTQTINMDLGFSTTQMIAATSGNIAIGGVISGSGGLTKSGTNTLTLTGTNTFNGSTTINAGTLQIDGNIANSGLVINSGGIISPGTTAAADSFGTSSITINGGGYNWTLNTANGSAGTGWDQITSTGALTSSGVLTIYAYGTPGDWDNSANYSWDIISANSVTGFSSGNFAMDFSNFGIASGNRTGTWSFSNPSGGIIRLSYAALSDPQWTGGTGNWSTAFSPVISDGDAIYFTGAGGGTATNNIASGTLSSLASINFQGGAGAYTLAANSGSAGNGSALTVTGGIMNLSPSTQTINMDLGFSTTQTIAANSGNIAIGGVISGAGGLTKSGTNTLTLNGNNTYTGATTISAGKLEIGAAGRLGGGSYTGNITNNGTLIYSGTNYQTLSGVISGSGALTKNGSGTLILTANNTSTGGTTVNAGTLQIGNGTNTTAAVAGIITLSGGNLTYHYNNTSSVNGNITLTAESTITRSNTHQLTFSSGTLNGGGQTLNISTEGTGVMYFNQTAGTSLGQVNILKGSVAYNSANQPLQNAAINVANGAQLGSFANSSPAALISFNNNITLNGGAGPNGYGALTNHWWRQNTFTGTITLASATDSSIGTSFGHVDPVNGEIIISGQVVGSGSLTKINGQRLTLSGNNTYSGTTTISAGILEIGAAGRLGAGSYSNSITNNGTLIYSGTNAQNLSGVISGTGNLTQNASSTLTLSSANTYNGTTTINAGTIQIGAGGTTGSLSTSSAITNNGTLVFNRSNAVAQGTDFANGISGTGSLTQNGSGTLTLSAANTYNGTTTINAGTIQIGAGGTTGSLSTSSAITNNGTLVFNRSNAVTQGTDFANGISGTGSLTQNGSGTLTLSSANSYSGGTTLNTGTLVIGNTAAAGNGTITQTDGTSLLKFDTTGTIANNMSIYNVSANKTVTLSGGITVSNAVFDVASGETLTISNTINGTGGVTKNGTGNLVLSGNNTYQSATVINSGTLNATVSGALGSNNTVQVNGGTLLVSTDDVLQGKEITLNGTSTEVATLSFNSNYNGTIQKLTLSANSIIDLGPANTVALAFADLAAGLYNQYTLSFYNWSGTTKWGTTYGNGTDTIFFGAGNYTLANVKFYSGAVGSDSFVGSGFEVMPATTWEGGFTGHYIIPVPEPETYATGLLLLLGGAWGIWRKRKLEAGTRNAI